MMRKLKICLNHTPEKTYRYKKSNFYFNIVGAEAIQLIITDFLFYRDVRLKMETVFVFRVLVFSHRRRGTQNTIKSVRSGVLEQDKIHSVGNRSVKFESS